MQKHKIIVDILIDLFLFFEKERYMATKNFSAC